MKIIDYVISLRMEYEIKENSDFIMWFDSYKQCYEYHRKTLYIYDGKLRKMLLGLNIDDKNQYLNYLRSEHNLIIEHIEI